MSDLEARIAEVLAEHMDGKRTFTGIATSHEHLMTVRCPCGWLEVNVPFQKIPLAGVWQAHVAEYTAAMLAPVIAEAQTDLVDALADLMDEIQNGALIAEVAAPVPGESGRQACIDAWDAILEEPAEWLRKKAAEHRGHERDHLQELLADAWDNGADEAMDAAGYAPGPRNAMYDRNPYRAGQMETQK